MGKKQIQAYKKSQSVQIYEPSGQIIHVRGESDNPRPKVAVPLLALAIGCALFLLAYAGPDIGNVLAYLVIPSLGFFPGLMVWERFGKVAGILAGLLVVTVLTPAYGASVIANSISLFTSLQTISQGVLVMIGIIALLYSVASLFTGIVRRL